jgi:uncharacterized lipoprotein YmbA
MNKLLRLLPLGVLVALAGCGSGEKRQPTFEVVGKVTDGSKPVANAQVVFHPVDATDQNVPKPTGRTDETGTFRLTTYDGFDGAPAGRYRVSVELWKTVSAEAGPVNQLPAKYASPDKSNLSATVSAGPNELQPFQIKR